MDTAAPAPLSGLDIGDGSPRRSTASSPAIARGSATPHALLAHERSTCSERDRSRSAGRSTGPAITGLGMGWPGGFARSIDYVNRDRPSDVKVPWEISRLQWLIPADRPTCWTPTSNYAVAARDILQEWIDGNPLGYTVNWSCTMEAAMRLFTWTWLFHVFANSPSWRDEDFRAKFLACLYLHGDFTLRHIEKADVNGNHYTADLAGLGDGRPFFSATLGMLVAGRRPAGEGCKRKSKSRSSPTGSISRRRCPITGWSASSSCGRHCSGKACGASLSDSYVQRLRAMARFAAAYSRPDGTSPLWGDADDAKSPAIRRTETRRPSLSGQPNRARIRR